MSRNDITGDRLASKIGNTKSFSENFDRIFGKKEKRSETSAPEHTSGNKPNKELSNAQNLL